MSKNKRLASLLLGLSITALLDSCASYKYVPYFQDIPDTTRSMIRKSQYKDLTIHTDDLLSITIQTIDPMANQLFSASGPAPSAYSSSVAGASNPSLALPSNIYLVDKDGNVALPIMGKIQLLGLTTAVARDSIQNRAAIYYKDPTVNVRFSNLKVTVLGEVARPGTYVLPNEKNTIFDALGLSGDLTIFGKRENVLLIRDSADQEQLFRFSLNTKDLISQPYFLSPGKMTSSTSNPVRRSWPTWMRRGAATSPSSHPFSAC